MRLASLVGVLLRDHYRRGAVLGEALAAALTVGLFLDPRRGPYEPSYFATVLAFSACVLPVLATTVVAARAGGLRAEPFLLAGGRAPYFVAVAVAGLLSSLLWLGFMAATAPFLGLWPLPAGWPGRLAGALLLNAALSAALFATFSTLAGSQLDWGLGMAALIMGLNRSWFTGLAQPWLRRLALLVPPLLENTRAAAGTGQPAYLESGVYLLCVLAIGVWRFRRREFYWS
ncbi:MAG: hypothetical protein Q8P31_04075 [Bacillota bacterium]|nr:hypothetical protein [Bacillota bacterium]